MEFHQLSRIISHYRQMIILLCLSSTATALFLAFALPEKYEATAMVLVRPEQNIKFPTTAREKELLDFP